MAKKQLGTRASQPRVPKALRDLRKALGLNEADWQSFLGHARDGFADFDRAMWNRPQPVLELEDVPTEWFEDPEALGYVAVRVLNEGESSLSTPVARFFLGLCDPLPGDFHGLPGIGLAWLHLSRQGLAPPREPARLAHLALHMPEDFFHGIAEEDLLSLCRLVVENRGTIDAWDLHALFAAVDRARIHVLAPFRLFHELMAVDSIPKNVKREFCRGLLMCSPEAERLTDRWKAIRASFHANEEDVFQIPRMWLELGPHGLSGMLPWLKRHAVPALVENVGEPLRDVIEDFFLRRYRPQQVADAISQGALDLIKLRADELGTETVRKLLRRAIKGRSAVVRHAAYRIGAELFGIDFARPARKDPARLVRDWAIKSLLQDAQKRGRHLTQSRRPSSY